MAEVTPEQPETDTCHPITVDGKTVIIRGQGPLDEQERDFLGEIVRAASGRYAHERPAADDQQLREQLPALDTSPYAGSPDAGNTSACDCGGAWHAMQQHCVDWPCPGCTRICPAEPGTSEANDG